MKIAIAKVKFVSHVELKESIGLLCLLFLISAAMLTLIQPPMSWSALAWVSLVPFILACSPKFKARHLAIASYVISLCYWLGNLYWMCPVTIAGWAAFCLYTALLWPILALCLRYCRMKKIPLFLSAAVLFVAAERLQGLFLGGFYWRFLAHSQYANIALIQIADIFGAPGVSFLIAMVNGLLVDILIAARQRNLFKVNHFIKIAIVCIALVATVSYGRWRIAQSDKFVLAGPLVGTLQSNIPQSVKRTFSAEQEIFDGLMGQSKAAAKAAAELIIWPETMVQAILDSDIWPLLASAESREDSNAFDKALKEHSKGTAFVLIGAYGSGIKQDSAGDVSLARYNSAFLYRPDGRQDGRRYDKIHLVPFGEVLPLRRTIPWFYQMLRKVKFIPYNFDYSLDYGREYTVFEMTSGEKTYRFSVMICYEDTVPAIARRFATDKQGRKRLDWLVNISNDGWFVRFKKGKVFPSTELPQHTAICVFRAVENRLAVVRSVNTGISCLIDTAGRVKNGFLHGDLPLKAMDRTGCSGWLVDRVPIDKRTTFFSKYGQWLDICCAGCLFLVIIVLLSERFVRNKTYKGSRKV